MTAHLKHKEEGNLIAVQFMPYDGLNVDLRIMFDHKCSVGKALWQNFKDYFYEHSLLKGEKFYADYKFINEAAQNQWEDIVISQNHRKLLQRNVVDFLNHMEVFEGHDLRLSRGVLITGPPGTGKTLTCNVLMNDVNVTTIVVTRETLDDIGMIGEIYKLARKLQPTLLIFEDIDTLGGISRYDGDHPLLGEFLNALSGVEANNGVVTLATTNHADKLDWALTDRPGRFDARMELGYPDDQTRGRIFEKYLKVIPHNGLLEMKHIVKDTKGLSGAYLEEIVRNAFVIALEESDYDAKKAKVRQTHLESATAEMLTHRDKAKKDLAKRDLQLDSDDAYDSDHSFG
jgi:cell division protease FtsH